MNKLNYILGVYLIPILMGVFGLLILIIPPFYDNIPNISKTTEISGTLNSYYRYKWGRGKSDYWIVFKLNEYNNEFEDSYLNERLCKEYLINNKSKLTFRIDNRETDRLNQKKRIKTIGTTIDGKDLQTATQDLNKDSATKNIILPLLGLVLLTLSYLINRKERKKHY